MKLIPVQLLAEERLPLIRKRAKLYTNEFGIHIYAYLRLRFNLRRHTWTLFAVTQACLYPFSTIAPALVIGQPPDKARYFRARKWFPLKSVEQAELEKKAI